MTTVSTGVSTGPNLQATRIIFPEPRRVELEQLEVSLEDLGPHEVVVRGPAERHQPGDRAGPLPRRTRSPAYCPTPRREASPSSPGTPWWGQSWPPARKAA